MPKNSQNVSVSVRLPTELVARVDACVKNLRLSKNPDISPENIYSGGRSAIVRLLLTIGLETLENGHHRSTRKRGTKSCPLTS